MKIKTIGIDLAKSVFQAHAVDEHGHLLPKDSVMRFRNPIRALRTGAGEGSFPHAASPVGDVPFSR